jgi:hypothetical protein
MADRRDHPFGQSMIQKTAKRLSEKHALGLDPGDHARTIS